MFVVAAVPMAPEAGISEDRAPFWLNRIFGSGRKRKTSTSRDIGESGCNLSHFDFFASVTRSKF